MIGNKPSEERNLFRWASFLAEILLLSSIFGLCVHNVVASPDRCWTDKSAYGVGEHVRLFVEVDVVGHYVIVITDADGHNSSLSPRLVSIEATQVAGDLGYVAVADHPLGQWTITAWRSTPDYKVDTSKGPAAVCYFQVNEYVQSTTTIARSQYYLVIYGIVLNNGKMTPVVNVLVTAYVSFTQDGSYRTLTASNTTDSHGLYSISLPDAIPSQVFKGVIYVRVCALGTCSVDTGFQGFSSALAKNQSNIRLEMPVPLIIGLVTRYTAPNPQEISTSASIATISLEVSLIAVGLGVLVGLAVWSDAKKLGDPNPAIWALGTALLLIIVLPIYLIYRSKGKIGKQKTSNE